jgi:anti-sigma-K factor RskA
VNPQDDARLDEIAALALGALPETEAREAAAQLALDAEAAREYAELRPVADLLGYSAETPESAPSELQSARMKSRLLRQIRSDVAAGNGTPLVASAAEASSAGTAPSEIAPGPARVLPVRPPMPWLAYLAAAACLAVAFLATFNLSSVRSANQTNEQQIALLKAQLDQKTQTAADANARLALTQSQLADLIAPGNVRYAVPGGVVERSAGRILIALQHLPPPPKGKVYQAWTLRKGAKAVAPSSTFLPDSTGLALVELPGSASDIAAVAVSIEPAGGSKQPTSKPNFIRPLS